MGNILSLHRDLATNNYRHSAYVAFNISDPKPRIIHKAEVRDRVLHHALVRNLTSLFEKSFIANSYSCRKGRGTHKALNDFRRFAYKESQNHTKTLWVLKGDIKKFFASIDQILLLDMVALHVPDKAVLCLLTKVVRSFYSTRPGVGLPLGNLTSQLLVNVYMDSFDKFVKHRLRAKYYLRYVDDFVVLSKDKRWLLSLLPQMQEFLAIELHLELHPQKVSIKKMASGVDFLGWVHFPNHRVLRTSTKKRMLRTAKTMKSEEATIQSYLGLLRHGNTWHLQKRIKPGDDVPKKHLGLVNSL